MHCLRDIHLWTILWPWNCGSGNFGVTEGHRKWHHLIACIWFRKPYASYRMVYHPIVTLCLKCTVFEIWWHICQKLRKKPTPLSFGTFLWGDPLRIFRRLISCQKLESWGYQTVYTSRSCFRSARHNTGMWQTDRRTDRHVAVAKTRYSIYVVARKNHHASSVTALPGRAYQQREAFWNPGAILDRHPPFQSYSTSGQVPKSELMRTAGRIFYRPDSTDVTKPMASKH